jgi:hypothetical protein
MSELIEKKRLVLDDDAIESAVPDQTIGTLEVADDSLTGMEARPDGFFQVRHLRRLLIAYEEQFRGTTETAYVAVRELEYDDHDGSQTVLTLQQSPNATAAVGLAAAENGGDDS